MEDKYFVCPPYGVSLKKHKEKYCDDAPRASAASHSLPLVAVSDKNSLMKGALLLLLLRDERGEFPFLMIIFYQEPFHLSGELIFKSRSQHDTETTCF